MVIQLPTFYVKKFHLIILYNTIFINASIFLQYKRGDSPSVSFKRQNRITVPTFHTSASLNIEKLPAMFPKT